MPNSSRHRFFRTVIDFLTLISVSYSLRVDWIKFFLLWLYYSSSGWNSALWVSAARHYDEPVSNSLPCEHVHTYIHTVTVSYRVRQIIFCSTGHDPDQSHYASVTLIRVFIPAPRFYLLTWFQNVPNEDAHIAHWRLFNLFFFSMLTCPIYKWLNISFFFLSDFCCLCLGAAPAGAAAAGRGARAAGGRAGRAGRGKEPATYTQLSLSVFRIYLAIFVDIPWTSTIIPRS